MGHYLAVHRKGNKMHLQLEQWARDHGNRAGGPGITAVRLPCGKGGYAYLVSDLEVCI